MTPERFRTLLAAYGAGFERWPQAERDAARALARATPDLATAWDEAARLDAWLTASTVTPPDAALVRRILAGAPGRPAHSNWRWLWPGTGLAAIGLAGALAGVVAVSLALRSMTPPRLDGDRIERLSAFSAQVPYGREE